MYMFIIINSSAHISSATTNKGLLCLMEAIEPSEYSYFAPAVLASWAGPLHWKINKQNTHLKEGTVYEWFGKRELRPGDVYHISVEDMDSSHLIFPIPNYLTRTAMHTA